jgi:hypothetical protein
MIAIPDGSSSLIVVCWRWMIALLLIPTAFAIAWLGHLMEGNKPAFLTNPVHVFVGRCGWRRRSLGRGRNRRAVSSWHLALGIWSLGKVAIPARSWMD